MTATNMYQGALITRDARQALLDLKSLVDNAAETIRSAEFDEVGLAIRRGNVDVPLTALRVVAESLRSARFETALSEARVKTETAMTWLLTEGNS
jgi:hypothetical protein